MLVTTREFDRALAAAAAAAAPPPPGGSLLLDPANPGFAGQSSGLVPQPASGPMTCSAWFRLNASAASGTTWPIAQVWDALDNDRSWALVVTGLKVTGRLSADGTAVYSLADAGGPNVNDGAWHMALFRLDGTGFLRVNTDGGAAFVGQPAILPVHAGAAAFTAGGYHGASGILCMWGDVAGVRIWGRELSDAECLELWAGGHYLPMAQLPAGLVTGLVHDWPLSEPAPGPYSDLESGGPQLVAVGVVAGGPAPP